MLGVRGAVLRERPGQRRLLLLVGIALLLVVELDEHLAGAYPVPEVGVDLLHLAVGLGRDRHLIDRRERADDVDRAWYRGLLDNGDGDGPRLAVAFVGLGSFGLPTAASSRGQRHEHENCQGLSHGVMAYRRSREGRSIRRGSRARGCGVSWTAGSAFICLRRGDPTPTPLPALALLAPVVSGNWVLGSAISSKALRKLVQAARCF